LFDWGGVTVKKVYKMKTVAEIAAKVLPPTCADRLGEPPFFTLMSNDPEECERGDKVEPRIYLGYISDKGSTRMWVEELGLWEKGSGWGSFHTTKEWFNIAHMPAIAYVGLFGKTYDTEALMSELARRIADELEAQP